MYVPVILSISSPLRSPAHMRNSYMSADTWMSVLFCAKFAIVDLLVHTNYVSTSVCIHVRNALLMQMPATMTM